MTAAFRYYTGEDFSASRHQSFIRKCVAQLTPERKAVLCNGVGSELPVLKWFDNIIPAKYKRLMRRAADHHDINDWVGGDDNHRRAGENLFLSIALEDMSKGLMPSELKYGRSWCYVAWWGIRIGDHLAFEYRDKPLTQDELSKLADNKIEARNV